MPGLATGGLALGPLLSFGLGVGGAGAGPTHATLLGAIHARVQDTPGLIGRLPGGFHTGRAPAEALASPPYGVLHEVDERYWLATVPGGLLADDTHLQVDFWGDDPDALKAAKVAWESAFRPSMLPLSVAGRNHVTCWQVAAHLDVEAGATPAGDPLSRQIVEFRVVQTRD